MRQSPKEQELEALETEFRPMLLTCLRKSANGRWGLFGQHDNSEMARFLVWPDADKLKLMAARIIELRSEFGVPNPLAEKFMEYYALRGQNEKGEPKLARRFLAELGEV
jgi:hypothetical protein